MSRAGHQLLNLIAQILKIDYVLLFLLLLLISLGLFILYSAAGNDIGTVYRQVVRLSVGMLILLFIAQIPPPVLKMFSPLIYLAGLAALIGVLLFGVEGKGAQRWLDLGLFRIQPAEFMKLAVPMMVAWFFSSRRLPPKLKHVVVAVAIVCIPMLLIMKQPDLGTALLVTASGLIVVFLSGIRWRLILAALLVVLISAPVLWMNMHSYQKQRVMTFINPESDPLGSGYHIIQSKIAIGSGGLYGKGWLNGTQSRLDFLPERHTDFIFSVFAEEFGWFGAVVLLLLYLLVVLRGLLIAMNARDDYSRLLAGSISLTFFLYLFVNVGMVTGLMPVVGVPLPLVSYGGTSFVTLMLGFGMLMSIANDRRMMIR